MLAHLNVVLYESIAVFSFVAVNDAAGAATDREVVGVKNVAEVRTVADASNGRAATAGQADQEIAKGLEGRDPVGKALIIPEPVDLLEFAAGADGVFALVPGELIAGLRLEVVD